MKIQGDRARDVGCVYKVEPAGIFFKDQLLWSDAKS